MATTTNLTNIGTRSLAATASTSVISTALTSGEIIGIIVGITAGIVVMISLVALCCMWKFTRKYRTQRSDRVPKVRLATDSAIPVTEEDFFPHVCQMKLRNLTGFSEEFASIKKDELQSACAFSEPGNKHKNRSHDVPCFDETRVRLDGDNDVDSYIQANFVPGTYDDKEYIYTQSPLPETVDDFWAMAWQQECCIIVMIGQLIEKEGTPECAPYFPDEDSPTLEHYCQIAITSRRDTADYTVRTFLLSKDDEERSITHYQYHGWPAKKSVPEHPTSFLQMLLCISQSIPDRPGKPIIVHGTNDNSGRAGVYVCVDAQIQRFRSKGDLSVFSCVSSCTKNRYEGVKTLEEYVFIHETILEAIALKSVSSITLDALPKYIEVAKDVKGKDLFTAEFEFLTSARMTSTQKMEVGSRLCNESKNRYSSIKPYDYNRVKLTKLKNQEGSDYINACFADTYKQRRHFIVTQAPLPDTIADFWRMVYEHRTWVILMLGEETESDAVLASRFWPEEGHAMKLEHITVKFISLQRDAIGDVWIRQLELMDEKGERKLLQLYQCEKWPGEKTSAPRDVRNLIQLVDQSLIWKERLKAHHVTIVSSSGIGRPGVLIAIASLQEEAECEDSVNVFRTVQKLNQQRPLLVQTKEEYSLIYGAALEIAENARKQPPSIDDDAESSLENSVIRT